MCGDEVPLPTEDLPASASAAARRIGRGLLPPEPYVGDGRKWPPADPPAECILKASRVTPPDGQVLPEPLLKTKEEERTVLDSVRIQAALDTCTVVKLVTDGGRQERVSLGAPATSTAESATARARA